MRGTIHLVTGDDCLLLRPLVQPVFEAQLRRHPEHGPALRDVDLTPVVEFARALLAEQPRSGTELRAIFAERFPDLDPAALAHACQMRARLRAGAPARPLGAERTGEVDHGGVVARPAVRRDPSIDSVVLRYLAAFGPASVADMTTWCRLTGMRARRRAATASAASPSGTSAAASSSTCLAPRDPRRTRLRRCASFPSTTTSCSRTTTAAASSVTPIVRRSDPAGTPVGVRCCRTESSAAGGDWNQ